MRGGRPKWLLQDTSRPSNSHSPQGEPRKLDGVSALPPVFRKGLFTGRTGEPRPEFQTLEGPVTMKINLAFMNDLDIVAVRIEHPCRVIARIVFGPRLR